MFFQIGPDLVATPVDERVKFPDVGIIGTSRERKNRGSRTFGALISAHTGDPEVEVEEFLAEGIYFAKFAAFFGVALPEFGTVLGRLLFDGLRRMYFLDLDAEVCFELGLERERLGKEQARIERESLNGQASCLSKVQDDDASGLEARANARARAEGLVRPAQTIHRRQRRETGVERRNASGVEVGHGKT